MYTLWLILNHLPQSKMLRPLGIKVFNLCIHTNSLLSLMDLDLGTSLDHAWIAVIIMAMKMSCHCCVTVMFGVKDMTLESVNDSVLCLAYIFDVAPFTFQAINEIVALACAIADSVVGCVVIEIGYFP